MSSIAASMFGPLLPAERTPLLDNLRSSALRAIHTASLAVQSEVALLERMKGDRWTSQLLHWHNVETTFDVATADMPVVDGPSLVVLLGRTQAGKSTLFRYLTGSTASEIGQGGQGTTQSVFRAPCAFAGDIIISDTPGVGAKDGAEDIRIALEEARRADLLVWVATTSSLQEQTREALDLVASWGTPLMLVVNCLEDLAEARTRQVFLKYPSRQPVQVLESEPGHLARVRRTLDHHGQTALTTIAVHADAARLSMEAGSDSEELRAASGVDELVSALRGQIAGRASARRATTISDTARKTFIDVARYSDGVRSELNDWLAASEAALDDLDKRAARAIQDAASKTSSAVRKRLSRLNDWADNHYADDEIELQEAWKATAETMADDLAAIMRTNVEFLGNKLDDLAADVWSAWERTLPSPDTSQRPKVTVGLNPTWLVPAARTGAGVIGAGIGFAIGGPIGLGAAFVATAVLERLSSWLFGGRKAQLRKRRDSLNQQVLELREGFQQEATNVWAESQTACENHLSKNRAQARREHAAARQQTAALAALSKLSRNSVVRLDRALTRAFLQLSGHSALASGITRVHRNPGSLTAVGLNDDRAVHESYLRPPPLVDHARFYPDSKVPDAARTVAHLWNLAPTSSSVQDNREHIVVRVESRDVATGLLRTQALVEECIGRPVQLQVGKELGRG